MSRQFMTLDMLSRAPEFKRLTIRQALWILTYAASERDLGTPDLHLATRVAFECGDHNVRAMAFQIAHKRKVQAVIRVWRNFGKSEKDIALADVRADIAASRPGSPARARLREIEAKLLGTKTKRKSR